MTGSSVGAVAGFFVGSAFGQPQLGVLAGSIIGGLIDPTIIKGPSAGDAQAQTSLAGAPIPKCYGRPPPIAPTLIDGDKIARKITRTEDVGKGATQKTETEAFIATRAFLVCEGEIPGYARITRNGKLVYSTVPGDELEEESASFAAQITIYPGSETQGPDPSLEALHGVGNTHCYRGRSYFVVRDDEEVGGAMNRYMVEVNACGDVTEYTPTTAEDADFYYPLQGGYADVTGTLQDLVPGGHYAFGGEGFEFTYPPPLSGSASVTQSTGVDLATSWTISLKASLISTATSTFNLAGHYTNFTLGFHHWHIVTSVDGQHITVSVNGTGGSDVSVTTPEAIPFGQSFVVTMRRTPGLLEMFFDGQFVASAVAPGSAISGSGEFVVGGGLGSASVGHLWGAKRALSDDEIRVEAALLGATPGLWEAPDKPGLYVDAQGNPLAGSVASTSISDCSAIWKDIVADIANRASPLLPAVLDIDIMTDEVPGFVLGNAQLTGTDYVRTLCTFYFTDLVEYDGQLHAIRRGGPIVATFTEDDLLAVEDEDDNTRAPALDAFKRLTVMYPDPANNYVSTPQTAPRTSPDITTNNAITLECPIPFDAQTMAQKADILQKVAFLQVEGGFKRAFPAEFSQYVPSDPIMFNDRRHIIVKASNDDSMVRFECQYDRPSAYTSLAVGSVAPAPSPQTSNLKGPTILVAMNLPPLRTAEQQVPGIYVAAMGLSPGWPGCDVMLSLDGGITESKVAEIVNPAEIGVLADDFIVGTGSEPALVTLYGTGELSSVTLAQIAARQNAAAVITANVAEIIQFQTVNQATSGDYELTDITRGVLETIEDDHFTGNTFVTLQNAILIPIDASYFSQTVIVRGVTKGTAAANNPTVSLVYEGTTIIHDGGWLG